MSRRWGGRATGRREVVNPQFICRKLLLHIIRARVEDPHKSLLVEARNLILDRADVAHFVALGKAKPRDRWSWWRVIEERVDLARNEPVRLSASAPSTEQPSCGSHSLAAVKIEAQAARIHADNECVVIRVVIHQGMQALDSPSINGCHAR